jgi:hypothetical protein
MKSYEIAEFFREEYIVLKDQDFLKFSLKGLWTYKIAEQNKVIFRFHSNSLTTVLPESLLKGCILYAKSLGLEVLIFTCHSNSALDTWFKENAEFCPVNHLHWTGFENYEKDNRYWLLKSGNCRKAVKPLF